MAAESVANVKTAENEVWLQYDAFGLHKTLKCGPAQIGQFLKAPTHFQIPQGTTLTVMGWAEVNLPLLFEAINKDAKITTICLNGLTKVVPLKDAPTIPHNFEALTVMQCAGAFKEALTTFFATKPGVLIKDKGFGADRTFYFQPNYSPRYAKPK